MLESSDSSMEVVGEATDGAAARIAQTQARVAEQASSLQQSLTDVEKALEEFVAEHYWAYTRRRDGGANEYRVDHRPWRIWKADGVELDADVEALYGKRLGAALRRTAASAFVADGSVVEVRKGARLW